MVDNFLDEYSSPRTDASGLSTVVERVFQKPRAVYNGFNEHAMIV